MKRVLALCLVGLAVFVVFGRATCQRGPEGITPEQTMKIKDHVYYHNVGITFGDDRYYTLNGGNEGWGLINAYDAEGMLLDSWEIEIDGRSIHWNPEEEMLYAKPYGLDVHVIDPDDGEADVDLTDVFYEENSSVAMSTDGEFYYELTEDGEVMVRESFLGEDEDDFELSHVSIEHGYQYALAASDKYLFAWDEGGLVYVYGLDGDYVDRFELPRDGFGFSLSWANGMLWIAEDADAADDGGDGYWYGYRLKGLE